MGHANRLRGLQLPLGINAKVNSIVGRAGWKFREGNPTVEAQGGRLARITSASVWHEAA